MTEVVEPREGIGRRGTGVARLPPPRVVVIGNLTLDDVVLPTGVTRMGAAGGNTIYAALGARMWEPRVGVVTRRGEDFPLDVPDEYRWMTVRQVTELLQHSNYVNIQARSLLAGVHTTW